MNTIINKKIKYNATYDKVFKTVLKDPIISTALINTILNTNYKPEDITYIDTSQEIKSIKSKGIIFDINIQTINKLITLEMQRLKPDYDFKNRLLFYLISNYSKTLVKGDKYNTKDTILICFTNFRKCGGNPRLLNCRDEST